MCHEASNASKEPLAAFRGSLKKRCSWFFSCAEDAWGPTKPPHFNHGHGSIDGVVSCVWVAQVNLKGGLHDSMLDRVSSKWCGSKYLLALNNGTFTVSHCASSFKLMTYEGSYESVRRFLLNPLKHASWPLSNYSSPRKVFKDSARSLSAGGSTRASAEDVAGAAATALVTLTSGTCKVAASILRLMSNHGKQAASQFQA